MINRLSKLSAPLLVICSLIYVLLSWVVFFRDERALKIYEKNYPSLAAFFSNTKNFLLVHNLNTVPTAIFIVLIIVSFALYLISLKQKVAAKKIIFVAICMQLIVVFSYPILSTDIYGYIVSDRLAVVHGQNVWTTRPDKFPTDKFFPLADYTNLVRIYGPVNQGIYALPTMLSGDDLLLNVLVHKLVVVLFVALSMFALIKILQDQNKDVGWGVGLVFWNPLLVIETAGSAHNDIIMLFFLLIAFLFFNKKSLLLSGIFVALSVQVKSTPLLLLPFLGIYFLRTLKIRQGVLFFVGFVITYTFTFLPMHTSLIALLARQGQTTGAYWQSLPLLIDRHLSLLTPVIKIALPLLLLVQAVRTFLGKDPWRIFIETLFFYLLFFLPTLWNWYCLWILVFVPIVLPMGGLAAGVVGFTFGSLLAYASLWLALRFNFRQPIWQAVLYGTILIPTLLAAKYAQVAKNN